MKAGACNCESSLVKMCYPKSLGFESIGCQQLAPPMCRSAMALSRLDVQAIWAVNWGVAETQAHVLGYNHWILGPLHPAGCGLAPKDQGALSHCTWLGQETSAIEYRDQFRVRLKRDWDTTLTMGRTSFLGDCVCFGLVMVWLIKGS